MSDIQKELSGMPDEWTEVNILLSGDHIRLLIDVVDPLIHTELSGHIDNWHYFWENEPIGQPHLRLRVRWLDPSQTEGYQKLSDFLDRERSDGKFPLWFLGNHGIENEAYRGEINEYGPEVWELTYKDWTSGSELALAIVKYDSRNSLTRPRDFHWERRAHLYSDQMLLREALVCLRQAYLYRRQPDMTDPRVANILQAIQQLFNLP